PVEQDRYELGKDFPRIAEIELDSSRDGRYVLATVANGDGGEYAHYLLAPDGHWQQITKFSDQIKHGEFGLDNALYLLSRQGAPRGKLLRLPLSKPDLGEAKVVVPESDAVIDSYAPSASGVYVQELVGGPSQIRFFGRGGGTPKTLPQSPVS